jgi:N-acetylmuramoyl-L-alanine amidase
MDADAGYDRAALLTAVMAQQLGISLANGIVQHHHWSGKHCPRVLRDKPNGWRDFLKKVRSFRKALEPVPAPKIAFAHHDD